LGNTVIAPTFDPRHPTTRTIPTSLTEIFAGGLPTPFAYPTPPICDSVAYWDRYSFSRPRTIRRPFKGPWVSVTTVHWSSSPSCSK